MPLSFAVAASSAVPALFSPLALESHHQSCARPPAEAAEGADLPEERRYLHLVDGGVADDCGRHRIAAFVAKAGGIGPLFERLGESHAVPGGPPPLRRIVFLSVNSERRTGLAIDQSARVPGAVEVINAMLYNGLGRQSKESGEVFARQIEAWRRELEDDPAHGPGAGADLYDVHIKLDELDDEEMRKKVLAISNSFKLSSEDRRLLRQAAAAAVARSSELQRFLASVGVAEP